MSDPSETIGRSEVSCAEKSPAQHRVVLAMRALGNELEMYLAAAGREHEMHRTDLAGLSVVMRGEEVGAPVTPGRLSAAVQLSVSATSAMLDRLEKLGYVRRRPHATDLRSVVVEMTDHGREVGGAMSGRFAQAYALVFADYDDEQLELVAKFLNRAAHATSASREGIRKGR